MGSSTPKAAAATATQADLYNKRPLVCIHSPESSDLPSFIFASPDYKPGISVKPTWIHAQLSSVTHRFEDKPHLNSRPDRTHSTSLFLTETLKFEFDSHKNSNRVVIFFEGAGFPHLTVRVNKTDVGKLERLRLMDITHALYSDTNYITFYHTLENQGVQVQTFSFSVAKYKPQSINDLVACISSREKISKQYVLQQFSKQSDGRDVIAAGQALSLKCPLSLRKPTVPCRGVACKHNQCFDAGSYLELQEMAQHPKWECPICNNPVPFEKLAVDEYWSDILRGTPKNVEMVTIDPSGAWHVDTNAHNGDQHTRPPQAIKQPAAFIDLTGNEGPI